MRSFHRLSPLMCVGLLLSGCMAEPQAANVAQLGLDFSWADTHGCFEPKSPAFAVSGAPAGTSYLKFEMVDLQAPSYRHGGGTIPYAGPEVPLGAFQYTGPCPPSGSHDYRWTVVALGADQKTILGRGSKTLPYHQ